IASVLYVFREIEGCAIARRHATRAQLHHHELPSGDEVNHARPDHRLAAFDGWRRRRENAAWSGSDDRWRRCFGTVAGGRSGLHRAGCWLPARRSKPRGPGRRKVEQKAHRPSGRRFAGADGKGEKARYELTAGLATGPPRHTPDRKPDVA